MVRPPKQQGSEKSRREQVRRQREVLRRTIEVASRRVDEAQERLDLAQYGIGGRPRAADTFRRAMETPGLEPGERPRRSAELLLKQRSPGSDLEAARTTYQLAWSALYSPEFLDQVQSLKRGDAAAIECGVAYLEADPWHFRSGYLKQDIARYLRHVPLSESDKQRLRAAILAAIAKGQREDLKEYIRLARVLDTPAFRTTLQSMAKKSDEGTKWRAERMLASLLRGETRTGLGGALGSNSPSPSPPPVPL